MSGCVPVVDRAVVMARRHEACVGMKCHRRHPARLLDRCQHQAGRSVPDRQVIAGGGENPAIGAGGPERFQIAQVVPIDLLARGGVPFPQDAEFLNGIQPALFAESHEQDVAVGLQFGLTVRQLVRQNRSRLQGVRHASITGARNEYRDVPWKILQHFTDDAVQSGPNLRQSQLD